jgi:hypothetical protein
MTNTKELKLSDVFQSTPPRELSHGEVLINIKHKSNESSLRDFNLCPDHVSVYLSRPNANHASLVPPCTYAPKISITSLPARLSSSVDPFAIS